MKQILITGAAGFVGFHLSRKLLALGFEVFGVDSLVPYYDVGLKTARLAQLGISPGDIEDGKVLTGGSHPGFRFIKADLADREKTEKLFSRQAFSQVVHLAAQAGVRESLRSPYQYIDSNINGLITILEGCRHHLPNHLVMASSSSVYGNNKKVPFAESDPVDHPISLYAATKKSGELMAYTYAHLFGVPITALRFFTVYGPWGRPDMAYYKFAQAIMEGRPIDVYNKGELYRDFTYVDDVVDAISRLLDHPPGETPPCSILNIGHSEPVRLMDFIQILEKLLGRKAKINYLPMQPGDVYQTYADVNRLDSKVGYKPSTSIEEGLSRFVEWFLDYHKRS
jgi:UDP-glucuronate 4-epimerase